MYPPSTVEVNSGAFHGSDSQAFSNARNFPSRSFSTICSSRQVPSLEGSADEEAGCLNRARPVLKGAGPLFGGVPVYQRASLVARDSNWLINPNPGSFQ